MRNRRRTIESLRRLAERPGTQAEGDTARRLLEKMGERIAARRPIRVFSLSEFPRGTRIFYCYWCYLNEPGDIACNGPKVIDDRLWMRIKFDRLKTPRWVPVISNLGCHLSTNQFEEDEAKALYYGDWDWAENIRDFTVTA